MHNPPDFYKYEKMNLFNKAYFPANYHCQCLFCREFMGTLRRSDGTLYSHRERRYYYSPDENHIAKTPAFIAKYAIQNYSREGDWVLDPTIGSGTTAVEALLAGRCVVGMDIEYTHTAIKNIHYVIPTAKRKSEYRIQAGDSRNIQEELLAPLGQKYSLIINNPPYSGDSNQTKMGQPGHKYKKVKNNLAFFLENDEYYNAIESIYKQCIRYLLPGGYFVLGVKDMMRHKKPYKLHRHLSRILLTFDLSYIGMILLPHWPPTLFMNTYPKRFPDIIIPRYQTITIFQKSIDKK